LQCVAACCGVLQRVAVYCSVQCAAVSCSVLHFVVVCCRVSMCVEVYSMVLQCVAVCCNVLQRSALRCSVSQCFAVCCYVLQCAAVCCSVLQFFAVCRRVLHCAAVCCIVLQCAAVCCSVLQCTAVCCSVLQFAIWISYISGAQVLPHTSQSPWLIQKHPATSCNILQLTAQHLHTWCSSAAILLARARDSFQKHLATYCNILQHTATNLVRKWGHTAGRSSGTTAVCATAHDNPSFTIAVLAGGGGRRAARPR